MDELTEMTEVRDIGNFFRKFRNFQYLVESGSDLLKNVKWQVQFLQYFSIYELR